jgi:hypothetical protein
MQFNRISSTLTAASAALVLGACAANQRTTTVESAGDVNTSIITPSDNRAIPVGAQLHATLDRALGTNISKVGDTFTATVTQNLLAANGTIVVPAGAKIDGRVTALDDSDNATEPAVIRLTFDRIRWSGSPSLPFAASIVSSNAVQTESKTETDKTKRIVIGGAVGAALGGLLSGGDLDKIVIGGAVGAAAGSIVSLGNEVNATLPAGSMMTLRTTQVTQIR